MTSSCKHTQIEGETTLSDRYISTSSINAKDECLFKQHSKQME